jgi:hypothetical protein
MNLEAEFEQWMATKPVGNPENYDFVRDAMKQAWEKALEIANGCRNTPEFASPVAEAMHEERQILGIEALRSLLR